MTIEKAELKRLTVQNVAKRVEALKNKSTGEVDRCAGASQALKEATRGVESVKAKWKRDLQDEKISPAMHSAVVEATEECLGSLRNLMLKYETAKQQIIGEVRMADRAIDVCQRIFDEEEAKIKAIESGEELDARPVGQHPGSGIASQRKAEESIPPKPVPPKNTIKAEGGKTAKSKVVKKKKNG